VPLDPSGQVGDVGGVEANGRAQVDGAEPAPLDESLEGARVHVEEVGSLVSRQ
jgi:hypothetical protein